MSCWGSEDCLEKMSALLIITSRSTHTVVLNEAAKECGVFACRFHLIDSICEVGHATTGTLEGLGDGIEGIVVQ